MERTLKPPETEQPPQQTMLVRNVMPANGGFRVIYNTPTEVPKIVRGAPAANTRPI